MSRRAHELNVGNNGVDVDGDGVGGDAAGAGREIGDAGGGAGSADGVVGDVAAGVAVPGAGTQAARGRDDVDKGHVGGTVADVGRGNRGTFAILAGRGGKAANFALVERNAGEAGLEIECGERAYGEAGVGSVAVHDGSALAAAAGKGNAERHSEEQEDQERN